MTKKQNQAEIKVATKELKRYLKSGSTIYSILRHVSSSGMTRDICFLTISKNQPIFLNHLISVVCDHYTRSPTYGSIRVTGCGMDMGFAVVYDVARSIFPKTKRAGYNLISRWL